MTDRKLLQRYALVVEASARIAAMSAENDARRFKGLAPAFDAISFEKEIEVLEGISKNLFEGMGE